MKKALDFLLYGNVFIALCAYAQTRLTQDLLHLPTNHLPFFVAAATFFLYNLHKPITFFLKPELAGNQRFSRAKRLSTPLSILTILAGIFCLIAFFKRQFSTQISLIGAGVFSLAYVLPVWKGLRLRDLPFIKIFLIAFVWAFVVVLLPITEGGLLSGQLTTLVIFLEKALFVFAITLPFDIRDQDLDRQFGVKTIPLSIGEKKSKILACICLSICFSMSCVLFLYTIYTPKTLLAFGITYFISAWAVVVSHKNSSDYFYYGLVDGLLIGQALLNDSF